MNNAFQEQQIQQQHLNEQLQQSLAQQQLNQSGIPSPPKGPLPPDTPPNLHSRDVDYLVRQSAETKIALLQHLMQSMDMGQQLQAVGDVLPQLSSQSGSPAVSAHGIAQTNSSNPDTTQYMHDILQNKLSDNALSQNANLTSNLPLTSPNLNQTQFAPFTPIIPRTIGKKSMPSHIQTAPLKESQSRMTGQQIPITLSQQFMSITPQRLPLQLLQKRRSHQFQHIYFLDPLILVKLKRIYNIPWQRQLSQLNILGLFFHIHHHHHTNLNPSPLFI